MQTIIASAVEKVRDLNNTNTVASLTYIVVMIAISVPLTLCSFIDNNTWLNIVSAILYAPLIFLAMVVDQVVRHTTFDRKQFVFWSCIVLSYFAIIVNIVGHGTWFNLFMLFITLLCAYDVARLVKLTNE